MQFIEPNDVAALEAAVTEATSAIVLEPVLGEGGIIPLTAEYLAAARRLADRTGAILIFDEIQCGLGRTGTLFAFQQSGVVPDIVTLAKPLGGGLPLGAVLTGDAIEGVVKPGHHGTTFGGNPVACRLGLAVLEEIEDAALLPRVNAIGEWFGGELPYMFDWMSRKRRNTPITHLGRSGGELGDEFTSMRATAPAGRSSSMPHIIPMPRISTMPGIFACSDFSCRLNQSP